MSEFERAKRQPISSDVLIADEVWAKPFRVPDAHTILPQHAHAYSHVSVIVRGSVRVTVDGRLIGVRRAPDSIVIEAGKLHFFETLEDDTIILCVHDVASAEGPIIVAENNLVGAK